MWLWGETQSIIVSVGDGESSAASAVLAYHRQSDGSTYEVEASGISGEGLLFEIAYQNGNEIGVYILDTVSWVMDGIVYAITLSDIGIDASYGVETEVETEADGEIVDEDTEDASEDAAEEIEEELEISVSTFDENGEQSSENSIEEAITAQQESATLDASSDSGYVVVVLDPGHDDTHQGTSSSSGLKEADLTLKIAQYCKAELEKYEGVIVYMTRTSGTCPYPGTSSSDDNYNRVQYAKSVGADVYVSIHLNSASSSSANGAEVYYPNSNYNASVGAEGKALASEVLSQLTALGLTDRGTKIRNSEDNTLYSDGSLADYYAVIKNSKKAGFPAIIIEHAFMSSSSDVSKYLSTESGLKSLGVADATGIANYYGLSVSTTDIVYNSSTGKWEYTVNGVADTSYTGFAKNSNGWWYVEDGIVTFNKNDVIKGTVNGTEGWYYVTGSKVDLTYNGFASNSNGWWYIENGTVTFTKNSVIQGTVNGTKAWWYVVGSKVQQD
ncbi:MAG: N-acetylmuramoyl-L-alanine amidase, partial [Lachnospiraceae bacterium]|nr:N-acetylmuramoyl-L-alanine amidase [Lachnospiraceae bacterium]